MPELCNKLRKRCRNGEVWGVNNRWYGSFVRKDTQECIGTAGFTENPASNRVLEKLGFTCLGERHHHHEVLPGFDTQVLWAITRENWIWDN